MNDLSASKAFYADLLGLPLAADDDWGVVLEAGDVRLFLHAANATLGARQHLEMTFDVDGADSAIAALKAKGIPVLEEEATDEIGEIGAARFKIPTATSSPFDRRVGPRSKVLQVHSRTLAHHGVPVLDEFSGFGHHSE